VNTMQLTEYKNKRVLLTGHTGFKGSWLSLWLHQLGAQVHGYALAPATTPNNFTVSHVADTLASNTIADIRDFATLQKTVTAVAPEIIFHLAAQPLVRESYRTPRETFEANVMGTVNLLECVRLAQRPCVVVVVTSDKCYENREHVWGYREIDAMGGHDPYSASKGATELVVSSYRRAFFHPEHLAQHHIKLASARAGNVIGGGDWAQDRIVVDAVAHLAKGEPIPVRRPAAVRPWQHVLEPLSGYLHLGARMLSSADPKWCDGWNFGPLTGSEVPVSELATLLCKAWGQGEWRDMSDAKALHEAGILRLSIDKATWELGWRPRWDLPTTIARTAGWYKRYYAAPNNSLQQACYNDIAAYSA